MEVNNLSGFFNVFNWQVANPLIFRGYLIPKMGTTGLAFLLASRTAVSWRTLSLRSDPNFPPPQGPAAATRWMPCTPARPATSSASTLPTCLWTWARAGTCPPWWRTPTPVRQIGGQGTPEGQAAPAGWGKPLGYSGAETCREGYREGPRSKMAPSGWFGCQGVEEIHTSTALRKAVKPPRALIPTK